MNAHSSQPFWRGDLFRGSARRLSGPTPYVAERIRWHQDVTRSPAKQTVKRIVSRGDAADIGAQRGLFTRTYILLDRLLALAPKRQLA